MYLGNDYCESVREWLTYPLVSLDTTFYMYEIVIRMEIGHIFSHLKTSNVARMVRMEV